MQVLVVPWPLVMHRKWHFEGLEFSMVPDGACRDTGEDRGSTTGPTAPHSTHSFLSPAGGQSLEQLSEAQ